MNSLLQWLQHNGKLISERTLLGYLPTKVAIVDAEQRSVNSVQVGKQFIHGVEIIRNFCPYHIGADILSNLGSMNQLRFVQENRAGKEFSLSWTFHIELDPEQGADEEVRLVECHAKTSGSAAIKTDLETDTHDRDTIDLKVRIT
jgi:hypothetical protein